MNQMPDGDVYGLLSVLAYATARALPPQQQATFRSALSEMQQAAQSTGSALSAEVIAAWITVADRAAASRKH